jgi:serine/threonine-protein kinase
LANLVYIERIGGGGFGEVWKARDRGVDALRAVKIVEPSAIPSLKDFNDEARVLNELAHDNIITVYGAEPGPTTGTTPDVDMYVIIMEYMDDGSLDDALQKEAFLPLREAVHRFSAACFAAAHAHGKGYIHRDIKPANILVSDARTKLSDFGLCVPGAVGGASGAGTLVYAAPEVADGNPTTVATDIYSLGVSLHELINGSSYVEWIGDEDELAERISRGRFPARDEFQPFVHDKLKRVLRKAMHVDASKRYADVDELRHALEAVPIKCNWTLQSVGNEERWTGLADGPKPGSPGGIFQVTVRRKSREFELRKCKSVPGDMRRVNADCGTFASLTALGAQQRAVMARVTETGK